MALHIVRMAGIWWAQDAPHWAVAGAITALFALIGYAVRGVNASGALAGAAVCLALIVGAGPGAFVTLLALFVMTWIATRVGRSRKQRLGTAERPAGRNASQVLANLGVAAAGALLYGARGDSVFLIASAAAMAEAAADTVSSELGQAFSRRALLITSLERVPPGTDGGVSLRGTASGMVASLAMGAVAATAGMIPQHVVGVVAVAGVLGMLFDSLLGAWLERAHRLGNDSVNFAGTLTAALVGAALASLIS
jgi:uncharacterized protein (TIGR00297 family)